MKLIDLIAEGKFAEAREEIYSLLNTVAQKRLQEAKRIIAVDIYEEMEELNEANIVRQGRIQKIRRRIRRNAKGRIIVQRNVRRSAIKGFRISGNTVKRIPAMARVQVSSVLRAQVLILSLWQIYPLTQVLKQFHQHLSED
jgi:PHD/YefM family antitoxin component YafN of YafNO toxin-antitoxin module